MKKEDAEEYTQALGQVVAGGWRQISLGDRLGVPRALGITLQDWVQKRLGGYIKLSIPERREAVKELTEEGRSQREIADVLGVAQRTISNDLNGEQNCSKDPVELSFYEGDSLQVEQNCSTPHVAHNSGENEWFTPADIIRRAIEVMGTIDVDPASHEKAQAVIRAGRWYGKEDDGLVVPWSGCVWLNPPYSQPLISKFAQKLIVEIKRGNVSQAICLTNNGTETGWGQLLLSSAQAVCLPRGRLRFWEPGGKTSVPLQGQMFCYFGGRRQEFIHIFQELGVCYAR